MRLLATGRSRLLITVLDFTSVGSIIHSPPSLELYKCSYSSFSNPLSCLYSYWQLLCFNYLLLFSSYSLELVERRGSPVNSSAAIMRSGNSLVGVRKSVDMDQLRENDTTEAFYCNTVQSRAEKANRDEGFYINVNL